MHWVFAIQYCVAAAQSAVVASVIGHMRPSAQDMAEMQASADAASDGVARAGDLMARLKL